MPVWASVGDCERAGALPESGVVRPGPGLREPEVQDLDLAVRGDLHVGGLEVAVDDALLVRFLEGLGDLAGDRDRVLHRHRAALEPLGEVLTLDELHRQEVHSGAVGPRHALEAVDLGDVRVVESGEEPGLAVEPGEPLGVGREALRQQLDRDLAPEPGVGRAKDLPHPPGPEGRRDPVVRQGLADHLNPLIGSRASSRGPSILSFRGTRWDGSRGIRRGCGSLVARPEWSSSG